MSVSLKTLGLSAVLLAGVSAAAFAQGKDLTIVVIAGKTGAFEAYAKQTLVGVQLGFEYATEGKMEIDGRKIKLIDRDDQLKPDLAKALLQEAYNDLKADFVIGTSSSGAALAMLPVAEENKRVLLVEPAVADQITGANWNRYIFRTARNSSQDAASKRRGAGRAECLHRHAGAGLCLRPRWR